MKLLSFKARRAVAVVIGLVLGAMYAVAQKLDPDTLRTAEVTTLRKHESISANVPVQRMDSMAFKQRGITDTAMHCAVWPASPCATTAAPVA